MSLALLLYVPLSCSTIKDHCRPMLQVTDMHSVLWLAFIARIVIPEVYSSDRQVFLYVLHVLWRSSLCDICVRREQHDSMTGTSKLIDVVG